MNHWTCCIYFNSKNKSGCSHNKTKQQQFLQATTNPCQFTTICTVSWKDLFPHWSILPHHLPSSVLSSLHLVFIIPCFLLFFISPLSLCVFFLCFILPSLCCMFSLSFHSRSFLLLILPYSSLCFLPSPLLPTFHTDTIFLFLFLTYFLTILNFRPVHSRHTLAAVRHWKIFFIKIFLQIATVYQLAMAKITKIVNSFVIASWLILF